MKLKTWTNDGCQGTAKFDSLWPAKKNKET